MVASRSVAIGVRSWTVVYRLRWFDVGLGNDATQPSDAGSNSGGMETDI